MALEFLWRVLIANCLFGKEPKILQSDSTVRLNDSQELRPTVLRQMRRTAVSVASNIAEGQGRLTTGEFQQFLGHARGSLLELDTQLAIACELGYLEKDVYRNFEQETYRVLGLINRLLESMRVSRVVS